MYDLDISRTFFAPYLFLGDWDVVEGIDFAVDMAVQIVNLTKSFGDLFAVNHINLEIGSDEIFGLLGPNGSGKTTLIRMLTTVLEPTEGDAKVAGYDVRRNPTQVRSGIRCGLTSNDAGRGADRTREYGTVR